MELFENLITYYENDLDDRYALNEMAKLTPKRADKDVCGDIPIYIYFSPCLDAHGPRVKFYGGTKETESTRNAPSYTFGVNGSIELKLQSWMNKKNCPNAFDENILEKVSEFINKTLSILLLVWFGKLDEDDGLAFFQGHDSFEEMLQCIKEFDEEVKQELITSKDLNDLHDKCKKLNVYIF